MALPALTPQPRASTGPTFGDPGHGTVQLSPGLFGQWPWRKEHWVAFVQMLFTLVVVVSKIKLSTIGIFTSVEANVVLEDNGSCWAGILTDSSC